MRYLFTLSLLGLALSLSATTKVLSRDYGYDPVNATIFLQRALSDATADTLIFDAAPGPWTTEPLRLTRSNVTLIFEPGTLLRGISTSVLPGAFTTFESLLQINRADNVTILGGGATFQMFKEEYESFSEFRHCLYLSGATNVLVRDLVTIGAAGDGIFISPGFTVTDGVGVGDIPCRNITIINCTMDDNNRQGMSVSDVIGLRIDSCRFLNTIGTEPQAGLDFEPFETFQRMQDILITNSVFEGNGAAGVLVGCVDLDATSPPMDIVMDNCVFRNNGLDLTQNTSGVTVRNKTRAPGSFVVRNSVVEDDQRSGLSVQQYAQGIDVSFENVVLRNTSITPFNANTGPILIQPVEYGRPDDDPWGNVNFDNVTVFDDRDRRHFTAVQLGAPTNPTEPPIQDVTGEVTICTPPGIEAQPALGPLLGDNVTITFPSCTGTETLDTVTGLVAPDVVVAGRTYPIEVSYVASEDRDIITTFQYDFGTYQPFAYVITPVPAGTNTVTIDIPIWASAPVLVDGFQWSTYLVPKGGRYPDRLGIAVQRNADVAPAPAPVLTSLGTTGGIDDEAGGGQPLVYPNPGSGLFNVRLNESREALKGLTGVTVSDLRGSVLRTIEPAEFQSGGDVAIDLSAFSSGIYVLALRYGNRNTKRARVVIAR